MINTNTKKNKYYEIKEIEENYIQVTFFPQRNYPIIKEYQTFNNSVRLITNEMAWQQPIVFRGLKTYGESPLFSTPQGLLSCIKSEAKSWARCYLNEVKSGHKLDQSKRQGYEWNEELQELVYYDDDKQ